MRITTKAANFRKGFTLVELLITVMILAILAAIMFYSSSEAITTAKATMIISNLKQISKAANMWYLDNYKRLKIGDNDNGFVIDNGTSKGITLHDYFKNDDSEILQYFDKADFSFNKGLSNYASKSSEEYYAPVGSYSIYVGFSNTVCYAVYGISEHNNSSEEAKIKKKLKDRAKTEGLVSYKFGSGFTSSATTYNGVDANVFMEAFRFSDEYPKAKN
ncbi:MAG: type II secretion system protein [Synergistaceae bacterium]|nr:type II secretion system protein [Synergistaceae bacterium]